MKATNQKKANKNPKLGLFSLILGALMMRGKDEDTASRRAFHQAFAGGGSPEFTPRKHIVMSYATQNRIAKKAKRNRAKSSKR